MAHQAALSRDVADIEVSEIYFSLFANLNKKKGLRIKNKNVCTTAT